MAHVIPDGYTGEVPERLESFLAVLYRHGFSFSASTAQAGKTINVLQNGKRCGYINESVFQRGGVIGYHFAPWRSPTNSCPPELVGDLVPRFCSRYQCDASHLVIQDGAGSNKGRTFLIINDPNVALRVLLQDVGIALDESVVVAKYRGHYVEGAVRDVTMQKHERSRAARSACLARHGYDCFVCGVNLRSRYGLPVEVIHVHHEEPMSATKGSREVDPIADMKPICPNCHAVIHSCVPPYSIERITQMFCRET